MARVIFYILKMKGISNRLNYLNLINYSFMAKETSLHTSFLIAITIYIAISSVLEIKRILAYYLN